MIWSLLSYIRNYVVGQYISWMSYFVNLFASPDYQIYKILVIFTVDPTTSIDSNWTELWNADETQTESYTSWFEYPVTKIDTLSGIMFNQPDNVTDLKILTSFWFRNEKKTYINTNPPVDVSWPPESCVNHKPSFMLPIKNARLVTLNDSVDVTSTIKKFSGPYGDFYGDPIDPRSFFMMWEPRDLEFYDYLEIIDILGFKKEYPIV